MERSVVQGGGLSMGYRFQKNAPSGELPRVDPGHIFNDGKLGIER